MKFLILHPKIWFIRKTHPRLVLVVKWHISKLTCLFFLFFLFFSNQLYHNNAILPKRKHKTQSNLWHHFTVLIPKLNHCKPTQNPILGLFPLYLSLILIKESRVSKFFFIFFRVLHRERFYNDPFELRGRKEE